MAAPAAASQGLVGQQQLVQNQQNPTAAAADSTTVSSTTGCEEKVYPKPSFSYSCLIALALKNSKNGSLPVSEIYNFMWYTFCFIHLNLSQNAFFWSKLNTFVSSSHPGHLLMQPNTMASIILLAIFFALGFTIFHHFILFFTQV